MEQILIIREAVIKNFKKHETIIVLGAKFLLGLIVYALINGLGLYSSVFSSVFGSGLKYLIIIGFSLCFTFLPVSVNYGIMLFNIALQLSSSIEICAIATSALLLVFLFYARIGTKETWLLLSMVLCFYFKVPYVVPVTAGLYFGITAFVPIVIGTVIWCISPAAIEIAKVSGSAAPDIVEMLTGFSGILEQFLNIIKSNYNWMVFSFIFTLMFFLVYAISKFEMNYAKELSIAVGIVSGMLLLIICVAVTGASINIFGAVLSSLISGGLLYIIRIFDGVLDYERAERVAFEDEKNYYYVKIVPKININENLLAHGIKKTESKRTPARRRPAGENNVHLNDKNTSGVYGRERLERDIAQKENEDGTYR